MITWSALNAKNFVNGSKKGKILIRVPSFNEMEEYIINSDLEGSIIKADPDVWNFCTGDYIYRDDIWVNREYKGSVPGSLCQDANGSNCLIFGLHGSSKNIRWAINDSYGGYIDIDIAYKNRGVSCYKQPCKMAADQQPSNERIYYLCAFRPVLEYKDNPKSENVFY